MAAPTRPDDLARLAARRAFQAREVARRNTVLLRVDDGQLSADAAFDLTAGELAAVSAVVARLPVLDVPVTGPSPLCVYGGFQVDLAGVGGHLPPVCAAHEDGWSGDVTVVGAPACRRDEIWVVEHAVWHATGPYVPGDDTVVARRLRIDGGRHVERLLLRAATGHGIRPAWLDEFFRRGGTRGALRSAARA